MKRNMEIIRTILLALEQKENASSEWSYKQIPDYPKEDVEYHFKLLSSAGLMEAKEYKYPRDVVWRAIALTWSGHDFLDAAKNEKIWSKAKKIVKEKGGMFSIEILKKILTKLAMGYVFPETVS